MRNVLGVCSLALVLGAATPRARADEAAANEAPSTAITSGVDLLGGNYSAFLHGPLGGARATALVGGGWDSAAPEWRAGAQGWLPIYGRFSLVLGASYRGATEAWRPFAGIAVALLTPRPTGTSLDLLVQYKSEGFSEPEGELELTLRAGRKWHSAALALEGSYGQDPEGNERDAEVAADASLSAGRFSLGLGGRGRTDLGAKHEAVRWDLQAGPHAGVVVFPGHFLGVATGVSVLDLDGDVLSGVFGLATYARSY
jgi:hypothetical protein